MQRSKFFSFLIIFLILPLSSGSFVWAVPAEGTHIMMATPSPYAVEVGKEIALKGGNVVDVAVAIGLTLAVTSPYYASLGGGGFALIKSEKSKKVKVLDFREVAPAATHDKYYLDKSQESSRVGGSAVGVPGFAAGLYEMHKKYGKLHWSRLFEAPIQLAHKGFRVSGEWSKNLERVKDRFNDGGKKHFLKKNGSVYKPGEVFRQKALAQVLKEMSTRNISSFYSGIVARDIADTVKKTGGVLTVEDLKKYQIRWLEPLTTEFAGHKIYLMPPPSSGGVVIKQALALMERLKLAEHPALSANELHLLAEIMSRSFRGRSLLGDPAFHENPLEKLFSKKYIAGLAKTINTKHSKQLKPLTLEKLDEESAETTHFSVLDKDGNAVSLTVTLNGNFGSAVVSEKFGIALNNEMDDFTTRPGEPNMFGLIQGKGNNVEPGKRPLSSMSPTLVEKNGKVVMSLGAPGGPRIINGVLQVLYRVLVTGLDMDAAIQMPRVHHQFLPHRLYVDEHRFSPEVLDELQQRGHQINKSWIARVAGVRINDKGYIEAAHDSRGEGASGGY